MTTGVAAEPDAEIIGADGHLLEEITRLNKFISPALTNRLLQFMSVAGRHDETGIPKRNTPEF